VKTGDSVDSKTGDEFADEIDKGQKAAQDKTGYL